MSRGLNKLPVFKEKRERSRMIKLIRENLTKYDVEIYAYCIMPNHFHLLIKADLKELASFMAKILAEFAKYYNFKHNRIGYVYQGRYKSQCIEDSRYFWTCLRYIHNNPMYLESLDSIVNYEYSSMKELYYGQRDILADIIFQLVDLKFDDSQEFLDFHKGESWEVFEDVPEETRVVHLKIAKELLREYETKYEVMAIEILDYNRTRIEFEKELMEILCISMNRVKEIVKKLNEELKGTG